jgi:alkanesulfonate monooxygenase SsuD/methylene tetrahydromethanopterin reductase-like flavin-dependent oxidoreductase (luciferase family)
MKFGLFGGARARGGPAGDSYAYHDFVNYVIEAEKLGFSSVFLVEHHFTGFGQVSASMSLLVYLAARTERIRLGTAVVVLPWHNPILVAEQAATLDLLSNGRLDFGVGKGYRAYEFSGFCIPPEEATERFDEAMEVIRKAWTSPGRFSYHGKRWRFDNVVVEPSPIQQPHPPFWLGAGSADSIRRAAREGYNLLLDQIAPTDLIIDRVATFRRECERIGRPYDPMMVGVTRGLQIVHNEEERKRAIVTRRNVLKNIAILPAARGRSSTPTSRRTRIRSCSTMLLCSARQKRSSLGSSGSKRAGSKTCCSLHRVLRSPVCAPSPRRSCRRLIVSRWR